MNTTILPLPNGDFTTVEHIERHGPLTVVCHSFRMGDVEDPDLYAAQPLWEWQESEMGKWIMSKAVDTPEWHRQHDNLTYGWQYAVIAKLKDIDYTFWTLKWSNQVDRQGIYTV